LALGYYHTLLLSSTNEVFVSGYNKNGQLGIGSFINSINFQKIQNFTNVTHVAAGQLFSLFLLSKNLIILILKMIIQFGV
jgi:alpha-tubulin suppressor-like RCC1 family protein